MQAHIYQICASLLSDWEEFLAATVHLNKLEKDEYLLRAFRHFDKDGSGSITANEIMAGLKEQGISQAEADDILVQLDDDENGSIRCEHQSGFDILLCTLHHYMI